LGIKFNLFEYVETDLSATVFDAQKNVAVGEKTTPGYAYLNLFCSMASFKFGGIDLQISGGIENIFNKEYRDHLSTSRGFNRSEPGRNLFVKLNLHW